MARVSRENFLSRLRDKFGDGDELVEILEDFADSFSDIGEENTSPAPDYESDDNPYKGKYNDIYGKYVSRFIGGDKANHTDPDKDDTEGNIPTEEEVEIPDNPVIPQDMVELFGLVED